MHNTTVPMCLKGESSAKNKEMFKEHLFEEPDEKFRVRQRKVYDYFQIETFYNTCVKTLNIGHSI